MVGQRPGPEKYYCPICSENLLYHTFFGKERGDRTKRKWWAMLKNRMTLERKNAIMAANRRDTTGLTALRRGPSGPTAWHDCSIAA